MAGWFNCKWVRSGSGALATRVARLIVSGMLSIPEMSPCSLISKLNSSNFVSMASMSPKLKFITLIKSVFSPCASLRYASYPFWSGTSRTVFRGPFVVSSARILLVPSFVCRDSLHFFGFAATACSSVNNVPSIVPTKHVSANSQSLCSSSYPLKGVGLFSRATSFAIVTVLTAPTVD